MSQFSPWNIASGTISFAVSIFGAVSAFLIVLFFGIYFAVDPHTYVRLAARIDHRSRSHGTRRRRRQPPPRHHLGSLPLCARSVRGELPAPPLIQARAVSMLPAVVILNQLVLGALFGILGLALATPFAAAAIVRLRSLFGAEEVETP